MEEKTEEQESEWWAQREKWVEEHYTDTPHMDTYIVEVRVPITFARENDGVRNVAEAREWLEHGDILESNDGTYDILSVEKKGDDRRVLAILKKVRDAVQRAEDAEKTGDTDSYNYWKGVAHGLNRGWDIHLEQCLEVE